MLDYIYIRSINIQYTVNFSDSHRVAQTSDLRYRNYEKADNE